MLYGLGVFGLYALLGAVGAPTFYDKLLCVPLLNLSVRWIDRLVRLMERREGSHTAEYVRGLDWDARTREPGLHGGVGAFFGVMASVGATDATHRGDMIPFWEQACADGRRNACERLVQLESSYCADNSGWACNELGRHYLEGKVTTADAELALG